MRFYSIWLLANILLITSLSTAKGEVKKCNFSQIKNGHLYKGDLYRFYLAISTEKEFRYYCNSGFVTPSGSHSDYLRCTIQGWEPAVPCLKECVLHYVENGYSLFLERKFVQDQSVKVNCYKGFNLPNGQDTIICTESGWTPQPICIPSETCSKSDIEIDNGFFSESDLTYAVNRKTRYVCKQGYTTANGERSGSITCLQTGWSAQPSCIKSCDVPVFENAKSKNDSTWFKLNDKLDYECHIGYENKYKHTKGSIMCTTDGWSDKPSCYEIECSIPILDPRLVVYPRKIKYTVGDLLKFSCRPGHRVGPDSVQCYDFGWSPSFPTCKGQVRSCGQYPELLNGEIKGTKKAEYSHGDVVEYDCKPRFLLKGPNKIQCVDGKWTTLPTCVEEKRTCGDLPELEHGSVKFSVPPYHHGDSVEFTCAETFTMIGQGSVSCISGRWAQLPRCVATDQLEKCKAPRLAVIGTNKLKKDGLNHNSSISYKCRGSQKYGYSICINGRWDPEPTCTRKEKTFCPPPPQIPNAHVIETTVKYLDGEKVSVLCQDGYLTQGPEEMVCKHGRWQSLPRCTAKITCSQPPKIDHGSIKLPRLSDAGRDAIEYSSHEHGTTFSYVCDDGFRISKENGVTCHMGKWSSPPRCVESTGKCGPPPTIENGDITSLSLPVYAPLSSVEYQCQSFYKMLGSKKITCKNGEWEEPPKCLHACVLTEEIMRRQNIIPKRTKNKKIYIQSGDYVEFVCLTAYQKAQGSPEFRTQCIDGHINYPTCSK